VGQRRIVKFSYDEPLTLHYLTSGYRGGTPNACGKVQSGEKVRETAARREYKEGTRIGEWRPSRLAATLGIMPTRVRFPVPAAELAASFHFEASAPPEVSIVDAKLLAGNPNPDARTVWKAPEGTTGGPPPDGVPRARHRRPSVDQIRGGYPTVDLHVADVPYGALSRAQIELQARPDGWLTTAVIACLLASTIHLAAEWIQGDTSLATTVLIGLATPLLAMIARPGSHRMGARLLSAVYDVARIAAALPIVAAFVFAVVPAQDRDGWLDGLVLVSVIPLFLVTLSWLCAVRRLGAKKHESPWEQHRPRDEDHCRDLEKRPEIKLLEDLEAARRPYDCASAKLGFDAPAIRVASSEGTRQFFPWSEKFSSEFDARLRQPLSRRSGS
jgi:hypothetical protein